MSLYTDINAKLVELFREFFCRNDGTIEEFFVSLDLGTAVAAINAVTSNYAFGVSVNRGMQPDFDPLATLLQRADFTWARRPATPVQYGWNPRRSHKDSVSRETTRWATHRWARDRPMTTGVFSANNEPIWKTLYDHDTGPVDALESFSLATEGKLNVYEVRQVSDWIKLLEQCSVERRLNPHLGAVKFRSEWSKYITINDRGIEANANGMVWLELDWDAASQCYDGIHLTSEFCFKHAYSPLIVDDKNYTSIAGWGPDQTQWLHSRAALEHKIRSFAP